MTTDFKAFNNDRRHQLIRELELDKELEKQLEEHQTSISVVNELIIRKMPDSTVSFIAMGLPKRQAAWWGLLVAKKADADNPDVNIQSALRVSEQWVRTPSEELRRQAKDLADALDLYSPTAWLAMSIFWSGDNIAPIGKTSVAPGENMSASALSSCINSALECYPETERSTLHNHFIKQGIHIAMGGNGQI